MVPTMKELRPEISIMEAMKVKFQPAESFQLVVVKGFKNDRLLVFCGLCAFELQRNLMALPG